MKFRRLLFAVLLATSCSTLFAAADEVESPVLPSLSSRRNHDAIDWKITMARAFTNFDSIEVASQISNGSQAQFTFHSEPATNVMRFELTPRGKQPITRDVNISQSPGDLIRNPSGSYQPQPGETVGSFQIDLRKLFGRLAAGEYKLLLRYPKTSFEVRDAATKIDNDLVSPEIGFSVVKTTPADARKDGPTMPMVSLSIDKKPGPQGMTIGSLSNNSNEPISFAAYMSSFAAGEPQFKPPLSTLMTSDRWHPQSGWRNFALGFCGTGLGTYILKPGDSVQVYITGYSPYGDGIYRYRLPYTVGDEKTSQAALSPPVVVDNLPSAVKLN